MKLLKFDEISPHPRQIFQTEPERPGEEAKGCNIIQCSQLGDVYK